MRVAKFAFILLVVCALGAIPAVADTTSYTISMGNIGGLGTVIGPYAVVTVDRTDATHATITFDSLTNGGNVYLMGGVSAVGVNVNATSWSISGITGSNSIPGFTPGGWADDGSKNVDGFGIFNQTVKSDDGFTHSSTEITFTLTNTSGTWADVGSVLAANSNGHFVEIHGFACATPCDVTRGAVVTGFGTEGTPIPEPTSLMLFGSGLVALAGVLRRKLYR